MHSSMWNASPHGRKVAISANIRFVEPMPRSRTFPFAMFRSFPQAGKNVQTAEKSTHHVGTPAAPISLRRKCACIGFSFSISDLRFSLGCDQTDP